MNLAVKLFGKFFDKSAKLQAELQDMESKLQTVLAERESIATEGNLDDGQIKRLGEIAAVIPVLQRRCVDARIPLLRLKCQDLKAAVEAAHAEWTEAKKRQHDIAAQFQQVMENVYGGSRHDAKIALKLKPESVRVALLTRGEARERLNEQERLLRLATVELEEALRASAKAQR